MSQELLRAWVDEEADALDRGSRDADAIVPRLGAAGVLRVGVPTELGGAGGATSDAIFQIAALAERSLTVAFVAWGQRAFIEYLLQATNRALRTRLLEPLLCGELGGATGLSNAIKFLSGLEALQVAATDAGAEVALNGRLPWVTNLRKAGFVVACAVDHAERGASIYAVPSGARGLERSSDLDLLGLRASDTAALAFADVRLDASWQLHPEASQFLRSVRPAFLGLQCGLAIGLARRSLSESQKLLGPTRSGLHELLAQHERELARCTRELLRGVDNGSFLRGPQLLFELRIRLNEVALAAVQAELEARGGKAYVTGACGGFSRRWREAAFLPIVTPSSAQLRAELSRAASSESA